MKSCARCHEQKPLNDFYKSSPRAGGDAYAYCKPCTVEWQREWRRKKRNDPEWAAKEIIRGRQRNERARLKARQQCLDAYGKHCQCCGESVSVFLVIDHINDDGAKQRRELFNTRSPSSGAFYAWLRKEGFPDGYQVLCHNCNYAKQYGCPHQSSQTV